MSKTYPVIGSAQKPYAWIKNSKTSPNCIVADCKCKATHRVHVEVNWFRGDDEVGNACDLHSKDAAAVLSGIEANRAKAQRAQAQEKD